MMTLLPSSFAEFLPSSSSPFPDLRVLLDPNSPVKLQELQNLNWTATEEKAQEFLSCIINLVSYNGCYVPSAFTLLVQGFLPKQTDAGYDLESSDKISHLIHTTLQKILSLVPLSMSLLGNALKDQFPHKRNNPEVLFAYLKNLLLVSYYAPSLIEPLLTTAVDRLIRIDVDIKLDDIPDEAEELQFEVELEESFSKPAAEAMKLDSMMLIMFEYLDAAFGTRDNEERQHIFPPMNLTEVHRESLFNLLLQIFDRYILTTYKSKYTQFLLFYVCRLRTDDNNSYAAKFMAYLFNRIQQKQRSVHQLASSAYLGSFLSRAVYLPPPVLTEVVLFILNWTLSYQNIYPNANPDAVVHGLFYSMSQSLYYIFCFHHKILVSEGNVEALKEGYRQITESKFNPLKVCLPSIVKEFVRISAEVGWFDYTQLLKVNEKIVLPTKSAFGGTNQLEVFFPFDPYLLKHSAKYITNLYLEWAGADDNEPSQDAEPEEEAEKAAGEDDEGAEALGEEDSTDDESDTASAAVDIQGDDENERESSDEMDQLTQDFMHFTPDVEKDLKFHFSFD